MRPSSWLYLAVCAGIGYLIHALARARGQVEAFAREQASLAEELGAVNAAKDQLLATVSHDLRTPLNAILGWSHLLRQGTVAGEQSRNALEIIERNARMQQRLISDLLEHSRIAEGKLRRPKGGARFDVVLPRDAGAPDRRQSDAPNGE